jgi:hypothetical protein
MRISIPGLAQMESIYRLNNPNNIERHTQISTKEKQDPIDNHDQRCWIIGWSLVRFEITPPFGSYRLVRWGPSASNRNDLAGNLCLPSIPLAVYTRPTGAIKTPGVAVYVKDADNVNPLVCCLFLPAMRVMSEKFLRSDMVSLPTGYRLELVYSMAHPDRARLYRVVARGWHRLVAMPRHNMKTKAGIRTVYIWTSSLHMNE